MDIKKLKNLSQKNEVRIDNHKGHKYSPPYYYSSLREAYSFYFNTFQTKNASYDFYVGSTTTSIKKNLRILEGQFLDEENTVACLVSFERFFELLLKDILAKTHVKLPYKKERGEGDTWRIIQRIKAGTFRPKWSDDHRRIQRMPFRETIERFYDLLDYSKDPTKSSHPLVKKFKKQAARYLFLDNPDHKSTFEYLNWYRDNLMHVGNKLPRLRLLDYIVVHLITPIVVEALKAEPEIPPGWLYFTKTVSEIDIFSTLQKIEFDLRNPKTNKAIQKTYYALLLLGHIKELGRANMRMNNNLRENRSAYEYNYRDVYGRGKRFAIAEKENHPHAKEVKKCPCCNGESMVYYILPAENGINDDIEWLKCYTCDYHIRYNVFDLHFFNPEFEQHFKNAH